MGPAPGAVQLEGQGEITGETREEQLRGITVVSRFPRAVKGSEEHSSLLARGVGERYDGVVQGPAMRAGDLTAGFGTTGENRYTQANFSLKDRYQERVSKDRRGPRGGIGFRVCNGGILFSWTCDCSSGREASGVVASAM